MAESERQLKLIMNTAKQAWPPYIPAHQPPHPSFTTPSSALITTHHHPRTSPQPRRHDLINRYCVTHLPHAAQQPRR